jgi:hypothetical protein
MIIIIIIIIIIIDTLVAVTIKSLVFLGVTLLLAGGESLPDVTSQRSVVCTNFSVQFVICSREYTTAQRPVMKYEQNVETKTDINKDKTRQLHHLYNNENIII